MSEKATQYLLRFYLSRMEDKVIWDYLQTRTNKTDYIKDLILKDITHERNIEIKLKGVLEEFFKQNQDINLNIEKEVEETVLPLPEENALENSRLNERETNVYFSEDEHTDDNEETEEPEEVSQQVKDFLSSIGL